MTQTELRRGTFPYQQRQVEIARELASILEAYSFDGDKGLCTDAGKHESNNLAAIYFSNQAMDCHSFEFENDCEDGSFLCIMKADPVECDMLGDLLGAGLYQVSQDSNGFLYGQWVKPDRLAYLLKEQELLEAELGGED